MSGIDGLLRLAVARSTGWTVDRPVRRVTAPQVMYAGSIARPDPPLEVR